MEFSTMVIKVKCGDILRRFNTSVNEYGELGLDMVGLRSKIQGLFNFPPDSDFTLTYIDEDGDVVTLVDDDDLADVMRQNLKFLRIDVLVRNDKCGKSYARSSGSSTPRRSGQVESALSNINLLKSVPEPLREGLSKLFIDLASTALPSNNEVTTNLIKCFTNIGQSPAGVDASSIFQTGPSQNPQPSTPFTGENASNDIKTLDASPKSDSTPKASREMNKESITSCVGTSSTHVSPAVDLNQRPPADANQYGCQTMNSETPVSCAGDVVAVSKNKNAGHTSGFPAGPLGAECMFSGIPMASDSFVPSCAGPFMRSNSHNTATGRMFHKGIKCDGCGAFPITGVRYRSKVKEDYDLCSICFQQMGNESDYSKMERPVSLSYWHPWSFRGLHNATNSCPVPPPQPTMITSCVTRPARAKLDSRFISDVNVLDGTMMAPSTPFTKIWRMRNSGNIAWPHGVKLMWTGGSKLSRSNIADIEIPASGIPGGGELDIAVDFTSPERPGRYVSYWKMASPSFVKFGQRIWVEIEVDSSLKDSQVLNLNLPPDFNLENFPEIMVANPPKGDGYKEPCSNPDAAESVKPKCEQEPAKNLDLNISINDTLPVNQDVSAPLLPEASSSVSYPIIDLSEAAPSVSSNLLPDASADNTVEATLLKELEEMGFKQVGLNKEILRLNEYNLEQSVDHLCDVSEWDPILVELHEMGFRDKETNKKLLKKNEGSISRVVMDLLTGEKA
ncbi:hypothetical protein K2173_001100 [Erythroxylum novogranatense]|uniref:Protein NBR1 homolog n=1 Tax=Erythroxylum novogranatense TaxID=1862640 RepID=A0AAV8SJD6_9ROSI|nr:hypothetical protein K2173_001100 [Erythroxylum novogranatense]